MAGTDYVSRTAECCPVFSLPLRSRAPPHYEEAQINQTKSSYFQEE